MSHNDRQLKYYVWLFVLVGVLLLFIYYLCLAVFFQMTHSLVRSQNAASLLLIGLVGSIPTEFILNQKRKKYLAREKHLARLEKTPNVQESPKSSPERRFWLVLRIVTLFSDAVLVFVMVLVLFF